MLANGLTIGLKIGTGLAARGRTWLWVALTRHSLLLQKRIPASIDLIRTIRAWARAREPGLNYGLAVQYLEARLSPGPMHQKARGLMMMPADLV